jgi:hypothetical protein
MTTYIVSEYDENCEEHFKINEIIPINEDKKKLLFLFF